MCVCLYTLWAPSSNGLWLADMYNAMEDMLVIMTQLLHNAWYIIKLTTARKITPVSSMPGNLPGEISIS